MPEGVISDIKKSLLSVLEGDATMTTLLGATASDPRIYPYYNGDAKITTTLLAFITYSNLAVPEAQFAVEDPVFSFTIWSRTWVNTEAVRDRMCALLDKQDIDSIDTPIRKLYSKKVGERDQYQEQPQYAGKAVMFRVGTLKTVP